MFSLIWAVYAVISYMGCVSWFWVWGFLLNRCHIGQRWPWLTRASEWCMGIWACHLCMYTRARFLGSWIFVSMTRRFWEFCHLSSGHSRSFLSANISSSFWLQMTTVKVFFVPMCALGQWFESRRVVWFFYFFFSWLFVMAGGTFALYSLLCRHANLSLFPNRQPLDKQLSTYNVNRSRETALSCAIKSFFGTPRFSEPSRPTTCLISFGRPE